MPEVPANRRRRLAEELHEVGLLHAGTQPIHAMLVEEIDHALRPPVHERRVASSGTIVNPQSDPATWGPETGLGVTRKPAGDRPLQSARKFTDGRSSWLLRHDDGSVEWMVFDRPSGSERDLVVLAEVFAATVVQRHPTGMVRVVGDRGLFRWEGFGWHQEPPISSWIDAFGACAAHGDPRITEAILEFAVHDLGALGIGALLIYRPNGDPGPAVEGRLPTPPPLDIRQATHLAPLRNALAQVDGAAIFDAEGVLRQLGVRLIPSETAEKAVDALGGTRHTSGRRYSYDDSQATVVIVSEDGPVSVFRNGESIGSSYP